MGKVSAPVRRYAKPERIDFRSSVAPKKKSKPPLCAATWDGKGSPLTCGAMRDRKKSISAPVWCHVGPERCGFRFCVVPRVTGNGFTARVHGPTRDQKEPIFAPVCTPWRHAGTERLSLRSSLCDAKRERKKYISASVCRRAGLERSGFHPCVAPCKTGKGSHSCVAPRGTGKHRFLLLCGAMQDGRNPICTHEKGFPLLCGATEERKA